MTVRFRPVEADEPVDEQRAAQERIYMGSAMTMEPGELALISSPMHMQLHAAHVCYASHVCYEPPSPRYSAPSPQPSAHILDPSPSSAGRSMRAAPLRCSKRPFLFLFLLYSYHSTNKTPAFGCSVTLGIRLSFHVHDHLCTRATCALHKPAEPFSLCI